MPATTPFKCGWCLDNLHDQCRGHVSITRTEGKTEYTKEWTCQCSHESEQ